MKIYITNLRTSTERRKHMQAECYKEHLEYSFVDCVVGNELSEDEINERCDVETINRYNKRIYWFNRGVIGCTLTNQNVYKDILSNDYSYALYLEDDIKLATGFKRLLKLTEQYIEQGDVILLNYQSEKTLELKPFANLKFNNFRLYEIANPEVVGGGSAFIVTKDAAGRMLKFNTPIRIAPDCWGDFLKANTIKRLLCVYPRPAETIFVQSTMQLGRFLQLRNFINKYRVFPVYNIIRIYKRIRSRDYYKVRILDL